MGFTPASMPSSGVSGARSAGSAIGNSFSPVGSYPGRDRATQASAEGTPNQTGSLVDDATETDGVMPDHLVPIGSGPFYISPTEPVDPWDCDRWANNLACNPLSGINADLRPGANFDFSSSNLDQLIPYFRDFVGGDRNPIPIVDACVTVSPSIAGIGLPPLDFCFSTRPPPEVVFPPEPPGGVNPFDPPLRNFPSRNGGVCRTAVWGVAWEWKYDVNSNSFYEKPRQIGINVTGVLGGWSVETGPKFAINISIIPPDPLTLAYPEDYLRSVEEGWEQADFRSSKIEEILRYQTQFSPFVEFWYSNVLDPSNSTTPQDLLEQYGPQKFDINKGFICREPYITNQFVIHGCVQRTVRYFKKYANRDEFYLAEIRRTVCGICSEAPRIDPPPTPRYPPVSCCPQTEEILRRIAKRIGIGEREAQDKYPIEVPIDLTQEGDETIEIETIPELLVWQARQLDSLLGQFPAKIKLKVEDENGDIEEQTVILHNVAETLSELFGMVYTTMYDTDQTEHMLTRVVSELIATKNAAIIAGDIAFASNEFLGGNIKKKTKKVASAFDIENLDDMSKFLSNGTYEIKTWINDDKNTATNYFQELMFAASIIKAVFYRREPIERSELLKEIFQTASEEDAASNFDWNRFVQAIENPQGRAATTRLRRDIDIIQEEEAEQ